MKTLKWFITCFVGPLKSGKTQTALKIAKQSGLPVVVVVPTPKTKNDDLKKIPFVVLSRLKGRENFLKEKAAEMGVVRLVISRDEGKLDLELLWKVLDFDKAFLIFDDFPALFPFEKEKGNFAAWASLVRHNNLYIVLTTQRFFGEVPPFIRSIVGSIFVIGPLNNKEDAHDLRGQSNRNDCPTVKEFCEKLAKNNPFSPFMVKG